MSETSKCRNRLKQFCIGNGLDLGYGGDPITLSAITVDLPIPYSHEGISPTNLSGDARNLFWFKDKVLDFVFSSHLLEDFPNTEEVLKEWLRVIKPGGHLILFCPDEKIYRVHCEDSGQPYNLAHSISDFGLNYLKRILKDLPGIEIVHEVALIDEYSFELVIRKK